MSRLPFKNGDRILFQGDSITDAGRRDDKSGLGGGYVAMIRGMLASRAPALDLTFMNRGNSGDRTEELLARWQTDTIALRPTWLSIMIGVNDVWRKRQEWNGQKHISLPQYRANYTTLLEQARAAGIANLVLISPTTIDDDPTSDLNQLLGEYDNAVRELARTFSAIYVPARYRLWNAIKNVPAVRWTGDGCHPTPAGHALLATVWLDTVMGA